METIFTERLCKFFPAHCSLLTMIFPSNMQDADMIKKMAFIFGLGLLSLCASLSLASNVVAVELQFPSIRARPGETIDIPLMVDQVDNLAGIKVVINYDTKILSYVESVKNQKHIVIDAYR